MENVLRHEHGRKQSADSSAKLTTNATSLQQKFVVLGTRGALWVEVSQKAQKTQSVSITIVPKKANVISIQL